MDVPQQSVTGLGSNEPRLQIDGLVARACILTSQDLAHLPRESTTEWLPNPYDGVTVQETWRGVRLLDVLRLAQPLPAAQYVRVYAGAFVAPLRGLKLKTPCWLIHGTISRSRLPMAHRGDWR